MNSHTRTPKLHHFPDQRIWLLVFGLAFLPFGRRSLLFDSLVTFFAIQFDYFRLFERTNALHYTAFIQFEWQSLPKHKCAVHLVELRARYASLFANFIKCMQVNITCSVLNAINSIKYLFCVEIDIDL